MYLLKNSKLSLAEIEKIVASLSLEQNLKTSVSIKQQMSIDVKKIVKIIQALLSDQMLYLNKQLKSNILNRKNGWIKTKDILSLKQIQTALKQIQLVHLIDQNLLIKFIKTQISLYPTTLKVNKTFIKRKIPFIDKLKLVKPIYIQNFPQQHKMKTICQNLSSITQIYKYKFAVGQGWGYVYAAEPQKILQNSYRPHSQRMQIQRQDNNKPAIDQSQFNFKTSTYQKTKYESFTEYKKKKIYIIDQILKPFPKSFTDAEISNIKQQIQKNIQQDYLKNKKDSHSFMQQMQCQMSQQQFYLRRYEDKRRSQQIKNKNINIYKRNQYEKKVDDKIKELIKSFMSFYQPNYALNNIFKDQNLTQNYHNNEIRNKQSRDEIINKTLNNNTIQQINHVVQTNFQRNFNHSRQVQI